MNSNNSAALQNLELFTLHWLRVGLVNITIVIRLNRHWGSDIKDLLKNSNDKSSFTSARRMFSKFKVETPPNAYQYQLPIVEVYEAEIRKLRCENEFLKVHVVQLNEALAQLRLQQAEKTPFRSTGKEFFQLTKSARNTKKRKIKALVLHSVQGLEEFVPVEVCLFSTYFILYTVEWTIHIFTLF